jgi:hypothetical protein
VVTPGTVSATVFMKSASAELRSHRLEGDSDARMTPAMAAIEPLVNAGSPETRVLADGWTVVTMDDGLSVHFEHTVAIDPKGREPLTHDPNRGGLRWANRQPKCSRRHRSPLGSARPRDPNLRTIRTSTRW